MLNAVLAPLSSSCRITPTACGAAEPPPSCGTANDMKPSSKSLRQASWKPGGVVHPAVLGGSRPGRPRR